MSTISAGEPPFYLSCSFCHWNSKEVGITFDKHTGLALQLQKGEDAAPELLEFDHLKDHLEPFLRRSLTHTPHNTTSATTAASASLLKDIPGLSGSRYGSLFGLSSRARGEGKQAARDELEVYGALACASAVKGQGKGKGRSGGAEEESVRRMREMTGFEDVAGLEKRWGVGWNQPLMASELKPLRTPLLSKRSKRCPTCKHILIKPEQKSSSTRFKIKLVASNYLPSIELYRRPPITIGSRLSAIAAGTASGMRRTPRTAIGRSVNDTGTTEEEPLRPGRTYTFELSFTNPLYESIQVRLAIARPGGKEASGGNPPPYAVNLPASHFPIAAYAEEWEYEDDEE
ncbi:dynactin 4, partial [Phenoliferia sp. Uapishka_3]